MTPSPVPASNETTSATAQLRTWLHTNAYPVVSTAPDHTGPDLRRLTDRLGAATVAGLGESTRFAEQTFGVRDRIFRNLVREHGYRALAIQDDARSGARLDRYVRDGVGDPESALADAWQPNRTAEMIATLSWIRDFNQRHPDDPVRVFGVEPAHANSSDYDAVFDHIRHAAPELLGDMAIHLNPIRTAHRIPEHVQRHRGIHPGRPFAEDARDALALLDGLPMTPEHDVALHHMRFIVAFHEQSVAGTGSFGRDERPSAARVIEWQQRTGAKIGYWDGIAHTSALAQGSIGSYLREHFGDRYASVAIGFHHGDLGLAVAPTPSADLVDALLGEVELPAYYVDLHTAAAQSVRHLLDGPAQLRVISGVYDPAEDTAARMRVDSLTGAFDILLHIRAVTPVHWLPQATA
ncbi:erythromycin esterase family protein [Nocardia arthritidis]|uniref:Erythromycin esterase family protein n=1 Tax=Nocardia arthritidis TaxID=228602 RepID=A0A6G9YTT4_9NOCA|nr:erythromycin esterase family protein [Nocardia arthritidis]QIS16550.1 erythromycin esterase family protein [Nocardia arthritidis]